MINYLVTLVMILSSSWTLAQNEISGYFPEHAGQAIALHGFDSFSSYKISSTTVNMAGEFSLNFSEDDHGMGYLKLKEGRPFFVVLAAEGAILAGENLSIAETVEAIEGLENQLFATYASEHPRRNQVLRVFDYLQTVYENDPLFSSELETRAFIDAEIRRLEQEDQAFLDEIPESFYVYWYLPLRKLVSSVSFIAQYSTEDIPATIEAFRSLDHTDDRLFKSGLLKDVIDSHYWLIENSGRSLDSVFIEMNISIDRLIDQLVMDEDKLNTITSYLFELLERRSLFTSAEHLALRVLNETTCTIDGNLANQLESYRAMKVGNIAPDFQFVGDVFKNGQPISDKSSYKLSQLKADYKVVVFGSAWCPACRDEIPQLVPLYQKWKEAGLEVFYISLDRERSAFLEFVKNFPFISFSDYQVWEMEAVKDYYVFGTPTYFLLDGKNREILLRPRSVRQIDAWVDWFLLREEQ
ncbi:MAG: TlpA family protein disulfide reductase [Saprospirales bacterium]|nr:MAG: TlpA family protein disulfide reductase [Saprospirales bacterium]